MSIDGFRIPPAQAPASIAAIAAAHRASVRAAGAHDPASQILFAALMSEDEKANFFGGASGWCSINSTNSRPIEISKSENGDAERPFVSSEAERAKTVH